MRKISPDVSIFEGAETDPRVALIHPPAISKRYLKTKFMPYGMSVIYAFLKEHSVPVVQQDFLMEYLFNSPEDLDYHNPEKSFSEERFFSFLEGRESNPGWEAFVKKYASRMPDAGIYAFSIVAYHQFWAALLLARHIRQFNPQAVIVFGGPFITIKPLESFVRFGMADYWVKGSGEVPLLMIHSLTMGRGEATRDQIPGLIYVSGDQICQCAKSELPAEAECAPDFEGLELDDYRYDHPLTGEKTFFLPYRLSKGCPSRCSFCTGRLVDRYDYKSVDKVIRELSLLMDKYGTNNFQFADASINGNPRQLSEICRRLSAELPQIRWYSYAKVNGFNSELLRQVKQAGCFSLFWGVESGHQPTVKLLGKHFDVEEMYQLLDDAIAVGIKNYVHLIYNTPHESKETLDDFIRLVKRYVDSDLVVFLPQRFLLEPQSLMFDNPENYGLSNVRQVRTPIFEREQYIFDEIQGFDHSQISERNDLHREMLASHLKLIQYSNILNSAGNGNLRRLVPGLLMQSWKMSQRFPVLARIHDALERLIQSRGTTIKEQL
ncbi:MAG: radical SAM protein [Desulfomonile tiedjei]|uniref:Radical SAM protein n=1 Tax=Desulfomonile tiedjei TaxID=2358 RepID=A0A9D6Z3G0_9BACT|nr:radical SAM protein [Desulfomonile tiedjei]